MRLGGKGLKLNMYHTAVRNILESIIVRRRRELSWKTRYEMKWKFNIHGMNRFFIDFKLGGQSRHLCTSIKVQSVR